LLIADSWAADRERESERGERGKGREKRHRFNSDDNNADDYVAGAIYRDRKYFIRVCKSENSDGEQPDLTTIFMIRSRR